MRAQIVLENVGVRLPNRILFEEVNWTLYEGMRVALAGRNGSGKSTLLKILSGQSEPSEGTCTHVGGRKLRVGLLDQSLLDKTVLETAALREKSLSAAAFLQHKIAPTRPDDSEAELEWEIRKILSGLGFNSEYMDGPMHHLSGGWLLRVFIAGALLERPEVLLLDEPTNHLDLSSIQWLEEFLEKDYTGSLVLVTHDVALQKRVTDSLAIVHGAHFYFRTHQRDYLTFRESLGDEKRILEKSIESLQKKIDENMDFVRRFRAKAQTAARAQSKLKAAEEFTAQQTDVKERLARLEGFRYDLKFRFRLSGPGGKFPLALHNVNFRYKEQSPWILKGVSFDIKRGQRVAIIGDNGAGKTTLLNVLAQRLAITSGELLQAHAVEMGYFGQHQLDELSLENTVLENLRSRAIGVSLEEMRGWLGAFGFGGNEDIEKKAKVLSGGERARLALLRILVTRINTCLLDEPTNHLDIETKELLKQAIREFEGTVIFVSHDREFIGGIAERILYLSQDHTLTDHLGDLNSFFEKYPQLVRHMEGRARPSRAVEAACDEKAAPANNLSFEERKKLKNQMKSLEKKIGLLEVELDEMGKQKDQLAGSQAPGDFERLTALEATLHAKMVDWEKWSTELEALKQALGR